MKSNLLATMAAVLGASMSTTPGGLAGRRISGPRSKKSMPSGISKLERKMLRRQMRTIKFRELIPLQAKAKS